MKSRELASTPQATEVPIEKEIPMENNAVKKQEEEEKTVNPNKDPKVNAERHLESEPKVENTSVEEPLIEEVEPQPEASHTSDQKFDELRKLYDSLDTKFSALLDTLNKSGILQEENAMKPQGKFVAKETDGIPDRSGDSVDVQDILDKLNSNHY